SNNTFYHVNAAVVMEATGPQDRLDDIVISDNDIRYTDNGGISVREGKPEDRVGPPYGRLGDVALLRNNIYHAGMRMERMSHGHCVTINGAETAHIAGNILHRTGGWGMSVRPGKQSGVAGDVPFTRYIIHQNKVVDAMLFSNDWGSIECWQGGPVYVYNNVVGNPVGYMWGGRRRFAHAYYLDGGFKNYHFNNIAWAESSTPGDHEASASAFQEIHSFQNTWFNNTVYKFLNGSRRQAPDAGRDKFLGNIFQDIGEHVFRHSDSKNTDPNAHDAGQQGETFAYETNAYGNNVLYEIAGTVGNFHAQGGDFKDIDAMAEAMAEEGTMVSDIGVLAEKPPLRDPANFDFRPTVGSAAIDRGVRVFVPWSLHGVVGEWHFTRNRKDPSEVIDEHWYMTDFYIHRTGYHAKPRYPLRGNDISAEHYIHGELEDWVEGALELDGSKQYLAIDHATLAEPVRYRVGKQGQEERVAQGADKRTVEMYDNDFLIEVYLRTSDNDGVIAQKMSDDSGYALEVSGGRLRLRLRSGGSDVYSLSGGGISDGDWHHVLVEVDRKQGATIYLDGKAVDAEASGAMSAASLANTADFLVGGGPDVEHLAATIDFLRVALGTLEDAHTSIEELMAWQFDGPQLRDFTGREPTGSGRDAGAIEAQ
ncbi:MAG: laminin G domain-containing protein, partial [Planctomycetota bacterium]